MKASLGGAWGQKSIEGRPNILRRLTAVGRPTNASVSIAVQSVSLKRVPLFVFRGLGLGRVLSVASTALPFLNGLYELSKADLFF